MKKTKYNYREKTKFTKKKNRLKSTIDPNRLVQKATQHSNEPFVPLLSYEQMNLHPELKNNLTDKGFKYPTEIQQKSFDPITEGRNVIGVANTGTGKTGSFLIPLINRLLSGNSNFQTLVVVPTRELANQVDEEFKQLAKGTGLHSACFIGGQNINSDIRKLKRKLHLVVGTPGRLIDLKDRKLLNFDRISVLILDEFDRMLDMGFVNDIKKMVAAMKQRKQTLLFSATIAPKQRPLILQIAESPEEVKVHSGTTTCESIEQDIIKVPANGDKFKMLIDLISGKEFKKILLFTETKRQADRINKKLNRAGVYTDQIHGNKSQNYRIKALNKFKNGNIKVLVATDVVARGIDVEDVSHVINYQLPLTFDSYVHRIGRTGRAGKTGMAYTFID